MPWAQLLISILGSNAARMSEEQQQAFLQKVYDEFGKIDVPGIQAIAAQELGPSATEGVYADEEMKGIQRDALNEILKVGRSGGMTLEDKANLNTIQNTQAQTEKAGQDRIREQMNNRGISGGGAELAMSLHNNQNAAQRASDEGQHLAGTAQRRALDSMMQGGRMAGEMRGEDISEKSRRAAAADARARYNADARNGANVFNAGQVQQHFGNQLARASGMGGAGNSLAGFFGNQAKNTRAEYKGYGDAAQAGWDKFTDTDELEDSDVYGNPKKRRTYSL